MVTQETEKKGPLILSDLLPYPLLFFPVPAQNLWVHKMVLPTFAVEFPFIQGEVSSQKPRGLPQPPQPPI